MSTEASAHLGRDLARPGGCLQGLGCHMALPSRCVCLFTGRLPTWRGQGETTHQHVPWAVIPPAQEHRCISSSSTPHTSDPTSSRSSDGYMA